MVDKVERFLRRPDRLRARQRARAAEEDRRRRLERRDPGGGRHGGQAVRRGLRLRPRRGGPSARGRRGRPRRSRAEQQEEARPSEEEEETVRRSPAQPMATSQRDVRNRIGAVKNIQKITRAMEMVAAARLRRAEQRIEALRPYADAIRRMTRQAAEAAGAVPRLPILPGARAGELGRPAAGRRRPRAGRCVQLEHRPRRRRGRARARGRGARRRCTSPPGAARRRRSRSAGSSRPRASPASPTGPPTPTPAGSPSG